MDAPVAEISLMKRLKRKFKMLKASFKEMAMSKIKTLVNTLQLQGLFGVTYRVDWPEAYEELVQEVGAPQSQQ